MNGLGVCAGSGALELGLSLAIRDYRTVCYIEREAAAAASLVARMEDQTLDQAPIWDDLDTFPGSEWRGLVDILSASIPCQPHSHAGKRRGKSDPRNLWPQTLQIIRDVEPVYVFLENVRGLADGADPYAAEIIGQLSEAGYDAVWGLLPAAAVGAPHLRWRWWCLAYSPSSRLGSWWWTTEQEGQHEEMGRGEQSREDGEYGEVVSSLAYSQQRTNRAEVLGGEVNREDTTRPTSWAGGSSWWATEPDMGRVADGVAYRVDRLRLCGNGVVPLQAAYAFVTLAARAGLTGGDW